MNGSRAAVANMRTVERTYQHIAGNVQRLRSWRTVAYCTSSLVAGHCGSVWSWCVSVFSLSHLCLFIVDSTVDTKFKAPCQNVHLGVISFAGCLLSFPPGIGPSSLVLYRHLKSRVAAGHCLKRPHIKKTM